MSGWRKPLLAWDRTGGAKAHRVPWRWLREPHLDAGERICVFVLLPRDGEILLHSADHVAAWRNAGYRVVVVVVVASLDDPLDLAPLGGVEGIALRCNEGYDFGAWAAAIRMLGAALRNAAMLALANDSVLGPSSAFSAMLDRAEQTEAAVIGLVGSTQIRRHFQSFVLFFKPRALRSRAFARFWRSVRSGGREFVIDNYETMLVARMEAGKLGTRPLFAKDTALNPTLTDWGALIDAGFPYIKVQLFRENPSQVPLDDWREVAARGGFDLAQLDRQIAALKGKGAQWQI